MRVLAGVWIFLVSVLFAASMPAMAGNSVRIKEIARVDGIRENSLVGYGLVAGLAGSGDSTRNKATFQSISNALSQFGITINPEDVSARNVATVMVTATLPPFAQSGDLLDVNVSSLGDARSLVGGTLLMAPLKAANDKTYAIAQGQVSVGGFKYDFNGNLVQKNHPTVGLIPNGATVERSLKSDLRSADNKVYLILNQPDFTTASRVKQAINQNLTGTYARAIHAGRIEVVMPSGSYDLMDYLTKMENISIEPDNIAKVVVNERTGTLVAGGSVKIDDVTISHGNIKIVISTDYLVSQPNVLIQTGPGLESLVVPDTSIDVEENVAEAVKLPSGASIADLVGALRQIKTSTRDVITILQLIKTAGALHAQLIIQ